MKPKFGSVAFNSINYFVFLIFTIICTYPFYYIFIYSVSDPQIAERGAVFLLPAGFTLNNYIQVLELPSIGHAAFISLSRTVLGTAVSVLFSSFFAYLMTKQELPGRKIIYRFMVVTMYVSAGLIPYYLLMKTISLNNNFLLYILPGALNAYFVILVKTYIEQIPQSLEESAMIDGAGPLTIFVRVIFPVCTPIIATISVFSAVAAWNSWFDNMLLANTPNLKTLQLLLLQFLQNVDSIANSSDLRDRLAHDSTYRITPMAVRMTMTMVVTLPILFVYPMLQRYFIKGIMMGAIKG